VSGPDKAIAAVGEGFGRLLSGSEQSRVLEFFGLLLTWNARINLTGARSLLELIEEHLPDSLALDQLIPQAARVIDVGAGGGLPALPLALLRPDVTLTLVEPRAKRVAFLRTAVRVLGLAAEVLPTRVEDLEPGGHDLASSRATFSPPEWLELGRTLVRPGGAVALFLSAPPPPDLASLAAGRVDYALADGRRRTALTVRSS
jgi:16S rRNA (guanine527-N7)-methyltransferase